MKIIITCSSRYNEKYFKCWFWYFQTQYIEIWQYLGKEKNLYWFVFTEFKGEKKHPLWLRNIIFHIQSHFTRGFILLNFLLCFISPVGLATSARNRSVLLVWRRQSVPRTEQVARKISTPGWYAAGGLIVDQRIRDAAHSLAQAETQRTRCWCQSASFLVS